MGWFDQQRPNIPSAGPRSMPAPVPGGGTLASALGGPSMGGGGVTGAPVPGQEAPIGMPPIAQAPGASMTGTPSSLAGYTGAPLNINVPFNPQSFVGSDAYGFLKDEGLDAVTRNHFARGTAGTGGYSRDLVKFAQGNASTFWGNQLDHDYRMATGNADRTLSGLTSLSSLGLGAAGGQAGQLTQGGNAAAGGTIGAQNAVNVGIAGAANSLGDYFARRRAKQTTGYDPTRDSMGS